MDLFIYIILFMMGTIFGSFFTLAVYRIPLKKDITHERSFCTTCGHRLEFLDLVPVLSYIFLKGKCRYCGEKIRIRYLLLEVLSGFVFLFTYISLNTHFPYFDFYKLVHFISFVFLYVTLAIVAGIDKEYKQIHLGVILFGCLMQTVYILYLYILIDLNIYRYGIYFIILVIAILTNIVLSIKNNKEVEGIIFNKAPYFIQISLLSTYILYITGIKIFIIIAIITMFEILIIKYLKKARTRISEKEELKIAKTPIGFYLNISTIAVIMITNFINYY